jgi:hypothetical protein
MSVKNWTKTIPRSLLLIFFLSISNLAATQPPSSWVKIPGTYGTSGSRDGSPTEGDFWYADDSSVINIRGVLNLTIADSEALQWHVATSCNPRYARYKQMTFSVVGTNHKGEWSPIGSDVRRNNAFKFICLRYGKVKHGGGYQHP